MESCTTWQCVNSFALWISAVGTTFISALALWLSIRDKIIRLNVSFDYGLIEGSAPNVMDRPVWILNFNNIGARTATISNFSWSYRAYPFSKVTDFFTFPHMEPGLGRLCSRLPCELKDGKSGNIFHRGDFFYQIEQSEKFLYSNSKFIAFYRIFTFKVNVHTTVSKSFKARIPKRARKKLWQEYRDYLTR